MGMITMGQAEIKTSVYWQRWWILLIFSLFTMWQCAVWNTWGPLADTAKKTFGWSNGTMVLFNLWGIIAFFIFSPVSAYLLSISLRYSVLAASVVMFLGTTVRCLLL